MEINSEHRPRPTKDAGKVATEEVDTSTAQQQMEALLSQINNKELDRDDPKTKEQLQALLQAIAGL